jgi:hypothetical protein
LKTLLIGVGMIAASVKEWQSSVLLGRVLATQLQPIARLCTCCSCGAWRRGCSCCCCASPAAQAASVPLFSRSGGWQVLLRIMLFVNQVRMRLVIPMVLSTVPLFSAFLGSGPVDITLNGLAAIFVLEADDMVGEAFFSPHYRHRMNRRLVDFVADVGVTRKQRTKDGAMKWILSLVALWIIFGPVWSQDRYVMRQCGGIVVIIFLNSQILFQIVPLIDQILQEVLPELGIPAEEFPPRLCDKLLLLWKVAGGRVIRRLLSELAAFLEVWMFGFFVFLACSSIHGGIAVTRYIIFNVAADQEVNRFDDDWLTDDVARSYCGEPCELDVGEDDCE